MQNIPGEANITTITIPGTYDSFCSWNYIPEDSFAQTIEDQLVTQGDKVLQKAGQKP